MKKQLRVAGFILVMVSVFASCKKNDLPTKAAVNGKSNALGGDGRWDLLGFGLDAAGDYLAESSVSDAPIIDMVRFEADYLHRLNVNTATMGKNESYVGYSAIEYSRDYSKRKSVDGDGFVKIKGTDESSIENGTKNFSGSVKKSTEDQSIDKYSTRYSYARFEMWHRVKRIRFNGDVDAALLSQYLMPDFVANLAVLSPDQLVERYGTHIMTDISIGGKIKVDYSGVIVNTSDYDKKSKQTKMGLGFSILGIFGININSDKTTTEITEAKNETRSRSWTANYIGGTNTGQSISIDRDGYSSENFNMASWQSSITPQNAALIDVENTIFLYDLITDPVKKEAVRIAVINHINSRQIEETGEVPIYVYGGIHGPDHYFTPTNEPTIGNGGFRNEGIAFYAFNTQKPGTVGIYSHYNPRTTDHYFTTDSRQVIASGFNREGIVFYAYPSSIPGSIPIYSHFHSRGGDHYFTPNSFTIGAGWVAEGIAFYGVR
jgi:hypothetical protein